MIPRGRPKKFENLDDLLTVQEAAGFLKVSPSTVRRLVASGEIPKVEGIGRAVRIRRSDLAGRTGVEVPKAEPGREWDERLALAKEMLARVAEATEAVRELLA
jgi:excisionase family DNA binding protein